MTEAEIRAKASKLTFDRDMIAAIVALGLALVAEHRG
jgi:hypothetical protein